MSRPPLQWWVRASNRAYGPYASERLPGFVREGRLTPETSVANDPSGPWWPAGRNPSLGELFVPARATAPLREPAEPPRRDEAWPPAPRPPAARPQLLAAAPAPAPAPPAVLQPPPDPRPQAAPATAAFVVFAELLAEREARFGAVTAQLGATVRARPGVWLLRTAADAAAVRNVLSQALGEGESLMVVRAEASDAAWFNLGGEADRALRSLWLQPTGRSARA